MKMWKAIVPTEIERVDVESATERYVYLSPIYGVRRGEKKRRIGANSAYFETWREARDWLLDKALDKKNECRKEIEDQEEVIKSIDNLQKPEG